MLSRGERCPFCTSMVSSHPRLKQRQKTVVERNVAASRRIGPSAMANLITRIPFVILRASKGNLRNARRYKRRYSEQHNRLRPAQRGFRSKLAGAAEIDACKIPQCPDLPRNYRSERTSLRHCQVSHTSRDIFETSFLHRIQRKVIPVSPTRIRCFSFLFPYVEHEEE